MNERVKRVSQIVPPEKKQVCNDGRWFLLEHQLMQARVSLEQVRMLAEQIGNNPENWEEAELADAVRQLVKPVYVKVSGLFATVKALLAGTDVAERIGGMEGE